MAAVTERADTLEAFLQRYHKSGRGHTGRTRQASTVRPLCRVTVRCVATAAHHGAQRRRQKDTKRRDGSGTRSLVEANATCSMCRCPLTDSNAASEAAHCALVVSGDEDGAVKRRDSG